METIVKKERLIGIVILGLIAAGVNQCTGAKRNSGGEISKSGDLDVFVTQIGDCLKELPNIDSTGGRVSTLKAIPCSEPHHWQVFYKGNSSIESYSEEGIKSEADVICNSAIRKLLSASSSSKIDEYQTSELTFFGPSSKSWLLKNDRTLDCLIGSDSVFYYSSIVGKNF